MGFPVAIGLATAAATYLLSKTASVADAAGKIDYKISNPSLRFLSLIELEIGFDLSLINDSAETFKVKHPQINLLQKGSVLAKNAFSDKVYTLAAQSQVTLDKMKFKIATLKLAGQAANIIKTAISAWKLGAGLSQNILNITAALQTYKDALLKELGVEINTEINSLPAVFKKNDLSGIGDAPTAIERPITPAPEFDRYFKMPQGTLERKKAESVHDTAKMMVDVVNQDYRLVQEFAQLFRRKSVEQTAKAIFDFVFKHIKYNLEDGEKLRNPLVVYDLAQRKAREFYKRNGYWHKDLSADCDDISIFIASILKNLNIPYAFRVSSYKDYLGFDRGFSHVYVVIPTEKETIIVDPVYHSFNKEKPFSNHFNLNENKKLVTLNGMDVEILRGQEDDILSYLKKTRDSLVHNKSDKRIIDMFDYAIRYWNTNREEALQHLENYEKEIKMNIGFFGTLNKISKREALDGVVSDNLKAFVAKYNIPFAIGTGLIALAIAYGVKKAFFDKPKSGK